MKRDVFIYKASFFENVDKSIKSSEYVEKKISYPLENDLGI